MITSIYFMLLRIAAAFNPKARKLVEGEKRTFDILREKLQPNARYIWFHAASVGEFEQGRPLIERLKAEHPERKIILTFFSPSGYELRKDYPLADIVVYLPFATKKKSRRFVDLVKPEMAVFIKYEFWPAYLHTLQKTGIPTYIIAAIFQPKQAFFRWYGAGYRKCLECFTHLFVQDDESAKLLAKYHINNVTVCGDPRFDRVSHIASQSKEIQQLAAFVQNAPVLVAGSSWPPDEELLIRYCAAHRDIKLILVPHEIHEAHLHNIFQNIQGRCVRFTEATLQNINSCNCMVVDTVGMLSAIYRYATVAYIGGGFGVGIHNTLEAAVYGVPVVFGPNYQRFREANGLIACGGGFSVANYRELEQTLDNLFANSKPAGLQAGEYVRSNLGATNIIYNTIVK